MSNVKYIAVPKPIDFKMIEPKLKNYRIIYENSNSILLENLTCFPRFYFAPSIIGVKDISLIKELIWNYDNLNNNKNIFLNNGTENEYFNDYKVCLNFVENFNFRI